MEVEQIYNSASGVTEYVKDLKTLHEVRNYRHNRGYNYDERMYDFKILDGFIWFDTCGNTMVRVGRDSYSPIRIPKVDSVCPVCGKGWSIYNLEDCARSTEYINGEASVSFYHKQCNFIDRLNRKQTEYTGIFDHVYPQDYSFKVIPNQYCQCEACAPWFVFNTPDGEIKIGWRKRVINIEWLDSYKQFTDTFENEETTKWFDEGRGIHAWGIDKCVEYLNRAKSSVKL
jgi:hypothetical protein